jgi:multiple sugar transport system substrate-binding protein
MKNLLTSAHSRRGLLKASAATAGAAALGVAPRLSRSASAQDAQKVRAMMWQVSPIVDEHFQNRATAFNEAHAGEIEVDLQFLPYDQYWQKLQLSYAANDPFDLYYWDVQAYGHFKNNLLKNLQPNLDAAGLFDPAQYPVELFEPWKLDGTNYFAVPENLQTMALFYNKTLFDAAGAAVPDNTWTYDNVIEAARALTIRNGNRVSQYGMALGVLGNWWGMQTISWARGATFFDNIVEPTKFQFSDPANIETLKFMQDLVYTEKVVPEPAVAEASPDTANFGSGTISMIVEGSWAISGFTELPFEWGMAPLPMIGTNRVQPYWMGGTVVAQASKVADAAFEWSRWSAVDYQPTIAAERDWIPVLNSARESDAMYEGMPAGYKEVVDALSTARLGDFYSANNQQIWNEVFGPNIQRLLANDGTPEEIAAEIDEKGNALL